MAERGRGAGHGRFVGKFGARESVSYLVCCVSVLLVCASAPRNLYVPLQTFGARQSLAAFASRDKGAKRK